MLPPLTYSSGNPDGEDFGAQAASISSPLSGPLQWMAVDLCERKEHDLYRTRRVVQSSCGPVIRLHGRDYLNFASNDYLGLAADARLARSAARAAKRDGCGAGASALVVGHLPPLRQLERDIARWEGTASALVFSSGWAANLSAITALVGGEDAIFSDELNHASLIDGCRLSRAQTHIYRHGDVNQLEELLRLHGAASRRRLIVTDSVFSMDGDFAPLPALLAVSVY